MTNDLIAEELSRISNQLDAAHVALGNLVRQHGEDGRLAIDAGDVQAYAAIEGIKSAHARLDSFIAQLPSYD